MTAFDPPALQGPEWRPAQEPSLGPDLATQAEQPAQGRAFAPPGSTSVAATGPAGLRSYEVADPSAQFRGGYGVVFQAVLADDHLGQDRRGLQVSLKMLSGADADRWAKLVRRSPELASLSHPNLAAHLEVFDGLPLARAILDPDEPTHHWTVNEWVPGQPLAATNLNMSTDEILILFAGAANAIDFLHASGVAHRDLHPRNLILTGDRRLVVIDYDTVLTSPSATTTRVVAGTRFSADLPEPARNNPFLADMVALARCLVHILARDGDGTLDEDEALEKAVRNTRPYLADPDRFTKLLQTGLDGIAPGCSTWVHELRSAVATSPRPGAVRSRRGPPVPRAKLRRPVRTGLVFVSAILLFAVATAFIGGGDGSQQTSAAKTSEIDSAFDDEPAVLEDEENPTSSPASSDAPAEQGAAHQAADGPVPPPTPPAASPSAEEDPGSPAPLPDSGNSPGGGFGDDRSPEPTVKPAPPPGPTPTAPKPSLPRVTDTFDSGSGGWIAILDAHMEHKPAGGKPGGFLSATDQPKGTTWYWEAPPNYRGNKSAYLDSSLTFDLTQSSEAEPIPFNNDIWLIGANGTELIFNTAIDPGTDWTSYAVRLDGGAGWRKAGGAAATPQDMRDVLGNLKYLRIRGEFSGTPDVGGLDNVVLGA